jgi:hypothetical protein
VSCVFGSFQCMLHLKQACYDVQRHSRAFTSFDVVLSTSGKPAPDHVLFDYLCVR